MSNEQLRLLGDSAQETLAPAHVVKAFDPARLTQARRLAGLTKAGVATKLGVSGAAVGQWEAGTTPPRPDHLASLAEILDVPIGFFGTGRPRVQVDTSTAHFRSLRSTRSRQREKAATFIEQVWELTYALEKRVQLPPVDLPGFSGGEVQHWDFPADPASAARSLRQRWGLGEEPIPHLVRTMETRGLIVTLVPFAGDETPRIDAFSNSHLPRPVVVLTPDRAKDVYRHRFTAAHELGHLLLHGDTVPGDPQQEREADIFAAELLTPRTSILPELPARADFHAFDQLSKAWGVSVKSLVYRSRELGLLSEATARRAYQRLEQLRKVGFFPEEAVEGYAGEIPSLLNKAFALAEEHGLTLVTLAEELKWKLPRLRLLLGNNDPRPVLRLL